MKLAITLYFILVGICVYGFDVKTVYNLNKVEFTRIELKVKITSYNNLASQTDDSPNIMASNRLVYEGAVAISRDLKSRYGIRYGDLIYIERFNKYYIIEDLMNKRFKNTIDIFKFKRSESLKINFKDQKVIIYKIKR